MPAHLEGCRVPMPRPRGMNRVTASLRPAAGCKLGLHVPAAGYKLGHCVPAPHRCLPPAHGTLTTSSTGFRKDAHKNDFQLHFPEAAFHFSSPMPDTQAAPASRPSRPGRAPYPACAPCRPRAQVNDPDGKSHQAVTHSPCDSEKLANFWGRFSSTTEIAWEAIQLLSTAATTAATTAAVWKLREGAQEQDNSRD